MEAIENILEIKCAKSVIVALNLSDNSFGFWDCQKQPDVIKLNTHFISLNVLNWPKSVVAILQTVI